jgi:LVIVD repeat
LNDNKESRKFPALPSASHRKAQSEATALCLLLTAYCLLLFPISACLHDSRRYRIEEIARFDTPGWAHDVALANNKIYVSDRQAGFLVFRRDEGLGSPQIFSPVKDTISLAPRADGPLLAARFEGLVELGSHGGVRGRLAFENEIANSVAARGDLAFVAFGLHGLVVAQPGNEGIRQIAGLPSPGWSHDIKLWREHALLADWNYGLRIVDIRAPEKPVEIAVVPTPATAIALALGNSPDGHPMSAVAEGHGGVSLVDLSDPAQPRVVARHSLGLNPKDRAHPESGGWAHGVAWSGRHIFVANWKRGLTVLDVHDLQKPRISAEYNTGGTALGVQAESAPDGSITVFLAAGEAGLLILRFTIDD